MVESPVKKLKINKKANHYDQKIGYTPAIQLKKNFYDGVCEVNVAMMPTMDQLQGSIFVHEILTITEEQMKEALAKNNVTEVERVKTMKSRVPTPNGLHVLTFSKKSLPEYVTIGYMRYEVRKYYPRPFRCNVCLKFGHSKKRCPTKTELCRNCGEARNSEKCQIPPRCVNCPAPIPEQQPRVLC
jgi:hypothetical protein